MLPIFVTEEGSNAIESLKHSLNVQSSIEVIEGGSDTCSIEEQNLKADFPIDVTIEMISNNDETSMKLGE